MTARSSRFRTGLLAALLATGCFSVPPFEPENAVSFTESGTGGGMAAGTGFALRFSDGPGFHFPNGLLIDGLDVMGRDSLQTCFDEDEIGFRIVPTARISATGAAPVVKNLLVPVLRGPGVVQTRLEWATGFQCNSMRAPGGTSTFTIFPDGRIVRFDVIADASMAEIAPSLCQCAAPARPEDQLFTFTTYWTLARASFTMLRDPDPGPLPGENVEGTANLGTPCIEAASFKMAFAWPEAMQTRIRGRKDLIEFGRDLGDRGMPNLTNFSYTNSSAIFIERKDCDAAIKRAEEHTDPSGLTINKAVVPITPSPRDGIYGGDPGEGGLPGIDLPDGRAELEGPVNSSFAVWLRFPSPVDAVRATLDGAPVPSYLPQQVDDRTWIVWFKDGITGRQKIVVEPR